MSNPLGTVASTEAVLTIAWRPNLGEALDWPADWTTDAVGGWFGQTNVTHDGVDAAQCGVICCEWTSRLVTHVTGPAQVSFWWKIQSGPVWAGLSLWVPEAGLSRNISGDTDWQYEVVDLPVGEFTLSWEAYFENTNPGGTNGAWVDQVEILPGEPPPYIYVQPVGQAVVVGGTARFRVGVDGWPPITYFWRRNGVGLPGATNDTLVLTNVQFSDAGLYSVLATNGVARRHLARLQPDGTLDGSFSIGLGLGTQFDYAWINTLALQPDGKILVGGSFSGVNGVPRRLLARLHSDGRVDESFHASYFDEPYGPI